MKGMEAAKQSLFSSASRWIWLVKAGIPNTYAEFERHFTAKTAEWAELFLSAEGQYEAYLNGSWLPCTQCADLPAIKAVSQLKVMVAKGSNSLRVRVWYPGENTSVSRREIPGLRFEMRTADALLCASDEKTLARADVRYAADVPFLTPQMGAGFSYTEKALPQWGPAALVDKPANCVPRPVKELLVSDCTHARVRAQGRFIAGSAQTEAERMQQAGLFYRPLAGAHTLPSEAGYRLATAPDGRDGFYLLLDLGQMVVGYLALDVECGHEARIAVGFGEHVDDLRVRTAVGGRNFAVDVTLPAGRHRFVHRFRRLGARYLQLFLYADDITVYEAGLLETVYPVRERKQVMFRDRLHERIDQVSRRTLVNCMHEHYEDCPWREQALYGFDSRNQMLAGYYAFGEFEFARASLDLLARSQREDGFLEICSPARVPITIPSFSLAFVIALEEYQRYSGDSAFAREKIPAAQAILQAARGQMRGKLMGNRTEPGYWNFYEWQPLLDGAPVHRTAHAEPSLDAAMHLFFLLALQRMSAMLARLGQSEDSRRLREEAQSMIDTFEAFWNEESGAYASFIRGGERMHYAELVQALALYTGACPAHRVKRLLRQLLCGGLAPVTLSYSIFKYEAILQCAPDSAAQVFDEIAQRWGRMLFQGATSFWETDEGADAFDGAGSLCHGWSAIPVYLYGAYAQNLKLSADMC